MKRDGDYARHSMSGLRYGPHASIMTGKAWYRHGVGNRSFSNGRMRSNNERWRSKAWSDAGLQMDMHYKEQEEHRRNWYL